VTWWQYLLLLLFVFIGGLYCGSVYESARVLRAADTQELLGLGGKLFKVYEVDENGESD